MKATYQSPKISIIKMQACDAIMLTTSDQTITGENGGWTKEDNSDWNNIWDE